MIYVLAVISVLALVGVVLGAVAGRLQVSGRCAVADPTKDLRMRSASDEPRDLIVPH